MDKAQHLVRPRWVWAGLLVALLGASLLGLGVAVLSWTISIAGSVILLLGLVASLRGGILYDARPGLDVRAELREVLEGDVHPGVAPGGALTGLPVRREAAVAEQSRRALEAASLDVSGTSLAPVAGWLLLLVTVVVVVAQWELIAHTTTGRGNSFRDTGLAILLGLGGLRLAHATGRQPVTVGVALLAGLGLLLGGLIGTTTVPRWPWSR